MSPEYFLDKMSLDEVAVLLRESNRRLYEKERLQCYFNLIAQGSKIKSPTDIGTFEWEKKEVRGKKYTKEQIKLNEKEAEKWLNKK